MDTMTPLEAAGTAVKENEMGYREAGLLYAVNRDTLRPHIVRFGEAEKKAGCRNCLQEVEEGMSKAALIAFADNGTPLTLEGIKDIIYTFEKRLPSERQESLPFKEGRPGKRFIENF